MCELKKYNISAQINFSKHDRILRGDVDECDVAQTTLNASFSQKMKICW